ncbi:MAG: hypothetical protein AAFQ13_02965 [Pseudomonadota bacterium]
MAIDRKLRGCDFPGPKTGGLFNWPEIKARATVTKVEAIGQRSLRDRTTADLQAGGTHTISICDQSYTNVIDGIAIGNKAQMVGTAAVSAGRNLLAIAIRPIGNLG